MAKYVGAVDQGTTSTRFMIFDHNGSVISQHQLEHEQIFPQAGWVEHDAEEIWKVSLAVAGRAIETSDIEGAELAAIGLTMHRRPETKYQDPSRQVTVKAKDRLRIIKMDAEEKA